MALLNVLLSGAWRVSAAGGGSAGNAFSALTPLTAGLGSLSVYQQQTIVVAAGVSEFVVSVAALSNPQLVFATATQEVRINFAGQASSVSAASAGMARFREAFLMMDVSGGLPSGFHFANSSSDSATITLLIAG